VNLADAAFENMKRAGFWGHRPSIPEGGHVIGSHLTLRYFLKTCQSDMMGTSMCSLVGGMCGVGSILR
jgi:hypothetical protein